MIQTNPSKFDKRFFSDIYLRERELGQGEEIVGFFFLGGGGGRLCCICYLLYFYWGGGGGNFILVGK